MCLCSVLCGCGPIVISAMAASCLQSADRSWKGWPRSMNVQKLPLWFSSCPLGMKATTCRGATASRCFGKVNFCNVLQSMLLGLPYGLSDFHGQLTSFNASDYSRGMNTAQLKALIEVSTEKPVTVLEASPGSGKRTFQIRAVKALTESFLRVCSAMDMLFRCLP